MCIAEYFWEIRRKKGKQDEYRRVFSGAHKVSRRKAYLPSGIFSIKSRAVRFFWVLPFADRVMKEIHDSLFVIGCHIVNGVTKAIIHI